MRYFYFIFIFVIFLSLGVVSADFSLDKGRLHFNLEEGVQSCQNVKVLSDNYNGNFTVKDIWPEIGEEDSSFKKYTLNATDYGITISHETEILNFNKEKDIEVCLSGENIGKFRGALVFVPEAGEGTFSVVVEKGVWLNVTISEKEPIVVPVENVNTGGGSGGGSGGSGGSGGGGSAPIVNDTKNETAGEVMSEGTEESVEVKDEASEDVKESEKRKMLITGSVIGETLGNKSFVVIVVAILVIGGTFVYYKRKKKRMFNKMNSIDFE